MDGGQPTRRVPCTVSKHDLNSVGAVSNQCASRRLFLVFWSGSGRIWDLGRANDAARRAGHYGSISFLIRGLLSRNANTAETLSEPLGALKDA